MKKLIAILLLVLNFGYATAQLAGSDKEVANTVEKLRVAMLSGDRESLLQLTSKNLSYAHSSGKIEDQNAFVEALASGKSDFTEIAITDQTVSITDNTAIVRHKLSGTVTDNGKTSNVSLSVLLVWVKQGKDWKLVARQAVKV